MLIDVVVNFPSDSKMIGTLRGWTNDTVATLDVGLRELGFGLVRVVGAEERVFDNTLDATGLLLGGTFRLACIAGLLIFIPLACNLLANVDF